MQRKYEFEFKYKKDETKGKELFIEGYANRASIKGKKVIDRGKESIPSEEWKIEEWLKNPIIFFNHDRSFPIGKGVAAKVDENGLWIKVKISNSKTQEIQRIRDLIEEEILRTFSVGIDVETEEEGEDGVMILKGVNLLETSVVSIPMNQESFFQVSKKMFQNKSTRELTSDILKSKGAGLASAIHNRIYDLQGESEEFDRASALTVIASNGNTSLDELNDILSGNTVSVSDELISALSVGLGLNLEELQNILKLDISRTDPDLLNRPNEDTNVDGDGDGENDNPDDTVNTEDTEDTEDKEDVNGEDFQKCVSEQIQIGISDGKDRDQAIAYALAECRKKTNGACELKQEQWDNILKDIDKSHNKFDNSAHVTVGGTVTPVDTDAANPQLQELRQTNQYLLQLIAEMQRLSTLLTGNVQPMPNPNPVMGIRMQYDQAKKDGDKSDKKEENDYITENYVEKLNERLKKLELKAKV